MTFRNRHVRVSVRPLTTSVDSTWGTPTETFTHARYQRLHALGPLSGGSLLKVQREGYDADWEATVRRKPVINDGDRLVTLDADGDPDLWFHVEKRLPRGRWATLLLQEIMEEQS